MQTFLPYPDFKASAAVLDYRRLGKQRVECKQLLTALYFGRGWQHHPAATMWRRYPGALAYYGQCCIEEWAARGYNNSLDFTFLIPDGPLTLPHWLGDPDFHRAHRSNLLRKDPEYYGRFGWEEEPDLPYIWPAETP